MAVLKHPNLDFDNGTAPNSIAELVNFYSPIPLIVHAAVVVLPHPDGELLIDAGGGGGGSVGYAS